MGRLNICTIDGSIYVGNFTRDSGSAIILKNVKMLKKGSMISSLESILKDDNTEVEFYKSNIIWTNNNSQIK